MSILPEIPEPPKYSLNFDLKTYLNLNAQAREQIISQTIALEEELIWHQQGITNVDLIKGWQQRSLTPEVAADWHKRGYLPYEVDYFLERNLSPIQADELVSIAEKQTIRAQKFPPILLSQIAAWKEYNFTFEESLLWLLNFWVRPDRARQWCDLGLDLQQAKLWWNIGITESATAKAWLDSGLTIENVKQWQQVLNNADPEWVKHMIDLNLDPTNPKDRELIQSMRPSSAIFWLDRGFQWSEIKAWLLADFKAYGKAQIWRDGGFSPQFAKQWRIDDRIIPQQAKAWSNLGLTSENFVGWYKAFSYPDAAKPWLEANFTLENARAWKTAGFGVQESQLWIEANISPQIAARAKKSYISLDELLIWRDSKIDNLELLFQWRKCGASNVKIALEWNQTGLTPIEFAVWQNLGVKDPLTVKQLIEQGYTPEIWQNSLDYS